jgi:hypothetical protein
MHVLTRPGEFQAPCDLRAFLENIAGKPVDLPVVHPAGVGHDQFKVIAAVRDERIDQELSLFIFSRIFGWVREWPG